MKLLKLEKRQEALEFVSAYFNGGKFESDLKKLVSFKTESQNPESKSELFSYLNDAILPRLSRLGLNCEIFSNPDPSGGPILVGERKEDVIIQLFLFMVTGRWS